MDRGAAGPMRVLPVGTNHGRGGAAGQNTQANRRRYRHEHDKHLPVRDVSADPERHPSSGNDGSGRCAMNSRRAFLKTSVAFSGGLVLSFCLPGSLASAEEKADSDGAFAPNVWLKIGTDDSVS